MSDWLKAEKNDCGEISISVSGMLRPDRCSELSALFDKITPEESSRGVVIDAAELSYISSMGLRVLLAAQKKFGSLRMENVSDEVYDILSLTGFTEILTVTKPFRERSVEGLPVLGRGGTATVYQLDDERIIKVFNEHTDLLTIMNEQRGARSALKAGIPTAIPFEIARVGNCYATVIELVPSPMLSETLRNEAGSGDAVIRQYPDFVVSLNEISVPSNDFKSMKVLYLQMAEQCRNFLTDEAYNAFVGMIQGIPEKDGFVHGDCHMGNIMSQHGEFILIDMATSGAGHWFFELFCICFTYVFVANMSDPEQSLGVSKETCDNIWKSVLSSFRRRYPLENWEALEKDCLRYAKLKALLSTLPYRELAEAYAPVMKQLTEELLADSTAVHL